MDRDILRDRALSSRFFRAGGDTRQHFDCILHGVYRDLMARRGKPGADGPKPRRIGLCHLQSPVYIITCRPPFSWYQIVAAVKPV